MAKRPTTDPDTTSKDNAAKGTGEQPTPPATPGATDAAAKNTNAVAAEISSTVRLRSRFESYCVRGTRFTDHVAEVPSAIAADLRTAPGFGPGLDFWEEQPIAASAA